MKTPDLQDSLYVGEQEIWSEQQRARLEEILNRERQYRLAIMEGAAAIYEINLSKDMMIRGSGYHNEKEYDVAERVGLQTPCVYSEFVRRMADKMLGKEREAFLRASLTERLIERFQNKELHTDEIYTTKDVKGRRQYLRKSYILTRNESTGDIWALIIAKNLTKETQMQLAQREVIEALSMEYTSVYLIDWETDVVSLFKTQNTYPGVMQELDETSVLDVVMRKYTATVVHPEDREYVLCESSSANMHKVLSTQKVLNINFRRIIDGNMDHAQMHCVRVDTVVGGTKIVVAFRSVEDIVRKEQEYMEEKARLTAMADRDGLTGMLNKEAFHRNVETYLKQDKVRNTAFLFLDLDHFKQINDTFGHGTGDLMIGSIADKMKVLFAESAFLGRFGGDEFCVFIKNVMRDDLVVMLEEVHATLSGEYRFGEQRIDATVSIGAVYCTKSEAEYKTLFDMADEALYEAKEQGRNRYILNIYK